MSKRNLGPVRLSAALETFADTQEGEPLRASMTFFSGAKVLRSSFFDGDFELSFVMDEKAADLSRLRAGAPFTLDHNRDVSATLGVIESAAIRDGKAVAEVRFSKRPEIQSTIDDIRDGILKNVSMEVRMHEMRDVTEKGAELKHFEVTRWEPLAISLVTVPADAGAQIAAFADGPTAACEIHDSKEGQSMDDKKIDTGTPVPDPTPVVDLAAERAKWEAAERKRVSEIRAACASAKLDHAFADSLIDGGVSINDARGLILAELAERDAKAPTLAIGTNHDDPSVRLERMADAIVARARYAEPSEGAREFVHSTLAQLAAECLRVRGRNVSRLSSPRVIELALTSSDFPSLLANAANKILVDDYALADPTYRQLSDRRDLPDFKTASILKTGDFPALLEAGEDGEIKIGSFSEERDVFALATYGRRLLFSFQMLVNDDLGALTRTMQSFARRISDFENALWFSLLTSGSGFGPMLGDGQVLFGANRGNLDLTGNAIDITSLGEARAAMMRQQSLDGLKLNIRPKFLLTSPEKLTLAQQMTTSIQPNVQASVNPFAGQLVAIADANLTDVNPWYLFADPAVAPVSVHGYLAGAEGPQVATREGFSTLGTEMRVALHFGVAFIDYRGVYKNVGA